MLCYRTVSHFRREGFGLRALDKQLKYVKVDGTARAVEAMHIFHNASVLLRPNTNFFQLLFFFFF